jgi:hypothetical protein
VIAGRAPGRTTAEQMTFYYMAGNWGVQFPAAGGHKYREDDAARRAPPVLFSFVARSRCRCA